MRLAHGLLLKKILFFTILFKYRGIALITIVQHCIKSHDCHAKLFLLHFKDKLSYYFRSLLDYP